MNDNSTGPIIVVLLFILRCLVPLGVLFGISYILQRLGLVGYPTEENEHPDQPHPETGSVRPTKRKRNTGTPRKRSRTK